MLIKYVLYALLSISIPSSLLYSLETQVHSLPHSNCYWVLPGRFLAGEYPGTKDDISSKKKLDLYLSKGINSFIDLTEEHELKPYQEILFEMAQERNIQVSYKRISIKDMNVPSHKTMRHIIETINAELAAGYNVYVHCWGGIGRTGTVVGCFLVHQGMSGNEALNQLAAWWQHVEKSKFYPFSPQTHTQRNFVLNYNS